MATSSKHRITVTAQDKTRAAFNSITGSLNRMQASAGKLAGALGFGSAAVGGALLGAAKAAAQFGDNIAKTSGKIGLSTQALQELRYAASQSGVEQRTLDMAMQRFSRRVGEAAQGTGELKGTLEKYNIKVRDSAGNMRPLNAIFKDYADKVAGAESRQEQLRMAFKAFDSEGAALVNLMNQGSAAVEQYAQEARDLGLILDQEVIAASVEATDEFDRMVKVLQINMTAALGAVMPWLTKLAGKIIEIVQAARTYIQIFNAIVFANKKNEKSFQELQASANTTRKAIANLTKQIEEGTARGNFNKRLDDYKKKLAELEKQMGMVSTETNTLAKEEGKLEKASNKKTSAIKKQKVALTADEKALKKYGFTLDDVSQDTVALDRLLAQGRITWDQYTEAIMGAQEGFEELETAATSAGTAAEQAGQKVVVQFQTMDEIAKNTIRNVQDAWVGFWEDILSGSISSFDDFAKSIKDIFIRMLAEMAAAWTAKKLFGGILGGLVPGGGAGGILGGIGGVLGNIAGGLGGLLGGIGSGVGGALGGIGAGIGKVLGGIAGGAKTATSAIGGLVKGIGAVNPAFLLAIPAVKLFSSIFGGDEATYPEGKWPPVKSMEELQKRVQESEHGFGAIEGVGVHAAQLIAEGWLLVQGAVGDNIRFIDVLRVKTDEFGKAASTDFNIITSDVIKLERELQYLGINYKLLRDAEGNMFVRVHGDTTALIDKYGEFINNINKLGLEVDNTAGKLVDLGRLEVNPKVTVSHHTVYSASGTGAKPPGFARGGQFIVGGSGGHDQNMVMFSASKGERVTVETKDQQRNGAASAGTLAAILETLQQGFRTLAQQQSRTQAMVASGQRR